MAVPLLTKKIVKKRVKKFKRPQSDRKICVKMTYQRSVTSRCYVTTFRTICDAFVEIINDELQDMLRTLHIHQFFKFPPFQQCISLLYEILKIWNTSDEGFIINGQLLKFTSDEVALLTGLPNRGADINWKSEPLLGLLSTEIKTEMTKLNRSTDNATKIKTFIMFLISNLFFPLNNPKTPRRLISIASNVDEFSSINWAASIRDFMVQEFNNIANKFVMEKSLGYINGFFPLLLIWFLEHFSINKPSNPELRPHFLRWEGNTDIFYTQASAITLFKFLKKKEIYLVLQDVNEDEVENLNADINAIQNFEIRTNEDPHTIHSPQPKKVDLPTPHSPLEGPPHSPYQDFPQTPAEPPIHQPLPKGEDWSSVQNKLLSALQNMCNRIEDNLGRRIDRIEDNLEKLEATVESLQYKFIHHLAQCEYDHNKSSISSSDSTNQSVKKPKTSPTKDAAPPPPNTAAVQLPTTEIAPPPLTTEVASPPPSIEVAPPPPPTTKVVPPPPTSKVAPPTKLPISNPEIIKYEPHKLKRKRDEKKHSERLEKPTPAKEVISVDKIEVVPRLADITMEYLGKDFLKKEQQIFMDGCFKKFYKKDDLIFTSGNIAITRADIDDLLRNEYLGDNHVDVFALLLSEKSRIMTDKFQPYLYISPLYRVYKDYKQPFEIFIQHINPDSVKESNLIVQPIIFSKHWILIIGRLKERVWKLYDSLPNAEHKKICYEVIKSLHEDKEGAFSSDIRNWNLQIVRGIPTQSNDVDCGMFVCKYMEKVILRRKTDWASFKDWQKYIPKFRAEFGYALFLTTKM